MASSEHRSELTPCAHLDCIVPRVRHSRLGISPQTALPARSRTAPPFTDPRDQQGRSKSGAMPPQCGRPGLMRVLLSTMLALMPAMVMGGASACGKSEICGLKNPEDMIRLADTRWAIVSRLGRDASAPGGFSLVDLRAGTARVLVPDVSRAPIATYSACTHAPAAADLVTHGLDTRTKGGVTELFAVNHGARESIEVFEIRFQHGGPTLTWTGCVPIPPDVSANAVAALPDGLAVTSFGTSGEAGDADLLAGRPAGFVVTWSKARGWEHVAGSDFGGDNGIAAAPDGSVLYVNDWNDGTLRVLPLAGHSAPAVIRLGDLHPDNIHFLRNGKLLIAGQVGAARDILACATLAPCSVASMIVIIDPRSRAVLSHSVIPATSTFGAASTALLYGRDLWLSSFRGDRIVRLSRAETVAAP